MAEQSVDIAEKVTEFTTQEQAMLQVMALPTEIFNGVAAGGTTGNTLVDLAVLRDETYITEEAKRYDELGQRIAKATGELALVKIEKGEYSRTLRGGGWDERFLHDHTRYYLGKLTDNEPSVDLTERTWTLPTDQYVRWHTVSLMGFNPSETLRVEDGTMPVEDYDPRYQYQVTRGSDFNHHKKSQARSTLQRTLVTGNVEGGGMNGYRRTSLLIGEKALRRVAIPIPGLAQARETLSAAETAVAA